MAGCHTGIGEPTAPQAQTTGWLGLATPVWLGYRGPWSFKVKLKGVLDPKFVGSRALMETYLKGQGGATQWDSEGSRTTGRPSQASMANNVRIVDFRSE